MYTELTVSMTKYTILGTLSKNVICGELTLASRQTPTYLLVHCLLHQDGEKIKNRSEKALGLT